MGRQLEDAVHFSDLDNLSQIHHGDPVRDVAHDRQIVRHEKIGQPHLHLEIFEEIDDAGADRNVQRGDRLVQHDHFGIQSQSAGNANALPLAARKLLWVAVRMFRLQPDNLQQFIDTARTLRAGTP